MKILDPDVKYMFPDEESMKVWFDEFNHRFFGGMLEPIELKVAYLNKRTHGGFSAPPQSSFPGFHPEECIIRLNVRFFDTEDEWRNTLLHEMVHYAAYKESDGKDHGHGKTFKRIAKRINETSEFKIEIHYHGRKYRPGWEQVKNWEKQRERDFVIGQFSRTWIEDFVDEDTSEVFKIERSSISATFKTTKSYMPEIIDNLSSVRGAITWFEVTACCQKLALLRGVNYTPDYHEEYLAKRGWFEEDIKDGKMIEDEYGPVSEFGPIECRFLGTTTFEPDGITGYIPGDLRSSFREQYFQNAGEIGRLAAEKLISIHQKTPQWFKTSHHGTYGMKPSQVNFTIEVDSRFIALVAMTPKKIQINPVWSEKMMELIRQGEAQLLAEEIERVITSRQNG